MPVRHIEERECRLQMLNFKMMPVTLWGMAVGGKSYKLGVWPIALAVTGGAMEFLTTSPISSRSDTGNSSYGLLLLLGFPLLDGVASTSQEVLC